MLVLSNQEVGRLLTMRHCMAALQAMYRDQAQGRALLSPRIDNLAPTSHPQACYAFKQMGGIWPAQKVTALRVLLHDRLNAKALQNVLPGTPNAAEADKQGWWNDGSGRFARYPDLGQLLAGEVPGRASRSEITCFVNNVGTELPDNWFSEDVHP